MSRQPIDIFLNRFEDKLSIAPITNIGRFNTIPLLNQITDNKKKSLIIIAFASLKVN